MRRASRVLITAALALSACGVAVAQRASSISDQSRTAAGQTNTGATRPAPAPTTIKAKYEGGVVGYRKSEGTLNFDDPNRRLLFRDKTQKELFSLPYAAVSAIFPDTQARRPTAATVISRTVPYGLGLPALLIKRKQRYLTVHYRDPDTKAEGVTSFRVENKEILASILYTLAEKSGLTQRGEAFVRRRESEAEARP